MSSSSSPVLVLELPHAWPRLLPAGVLLIVGITLPWFAFALPLMWRELVVVVAVSLAWLAARQAGLGRSDNRLIRITWRQDLEWRLQFAVGEPVQAQLSRRSWILPWLMCWRFSDAANRSHNLLLWRPLAQASWRQWQLRLRLEGAQAAAAVASESWQ